MANLEVSDILLDPDFSQPVAIQRAAQGVTEQGLAVTSGTTAQIVACVVPAGSLELNRGMDAELLKGKIHVFTQFPLTSGDGQVGADIVIWQGRRYTVSAVDEYAFGVGFVDATADLQPTHNQFGN
jgi:hypothetical protein